jgi:hypothetical protein
MDETKVAPEVESKETEVTPAEASTDVEQAKVGDVFKVEAKEAKMVPESVLIEYKKEAKTVRKELDALRKSIDEGANRGEVSKSIKDIAEKHNVDADFLREFSEAVKKEAESDIEERVASRMKPLEESEIATKKDKIFEEHFDKTLEEMPEFKKIINKDVIKTLAFDPKNANKTFAQIFQESYGHLVTGKKTLDTTKPRGGAKDTSIDFEKASKDSTYFAEVMADPTLKAEYNKRLISQNRF